MWKSTYKLLTGNALPDVFEYPVDTGPLRLVENKYDIINSMPKMGPRTRLPDSGARTGGIRVNVPGSHPGEGVKDPSAARGKKIRPPSPPSSDSDGLAPNSHGERLAPVPTGESSKKRRRSPSPPAVASA